MLLQSLNHIVGDEIALVLAEALAHSTDQLARPHERQRNRKPEHVAAGPHMWEHIKNILKWEAW